MVEVLHREKQNCEHMLAKFPDASSYDIVIDSDTDLYSSLDSALIKDESERNVIFKFRKGVFSQEEQLGAYEGLKEGATITGQRSVASGFLTEEDLPEMFRQRHQEVLAALRGEADLESVLQEWANGKQPVEKRNQKYWSAKRVKDYYGYDVFLTNDQYNEEWFDQWLKSLDNYSPEEKKKEAELLEERCVKLGGGGHDVHSGVAGFFDRTPLFPYGKECGYNKSKPEKWALAQPYLRTLSRKFEELLPERHSKQKAHCDSLDQRFVISGTVFNTVTINKTFQTACHRDAGDFSAGFSNISAVSDGVNEWTGGLFVLPEYRVAVNLRPGDLLLVNNHEGIHGNTPMEGERVSIVAYARERMTRMGTWEYEQARREFVSQRRKNKDHPLWREGWNGNSVNQFQQPEFHDWLKATHPEESKEWLNNYHPESLEVSSLESFFG